MHTGSRLEKSEELILEIFLVDKALDQLPQKRLQWMLDLGLTRS